MFNAIDSTVPQVVLAHSDFGVYLDLQHGPRPITEPVARCRRTVVRTYLSLRYMSLFPRRAGKKRRE